MEYILTALQYLHTRVFTPNHKITWWQKCEEDYIWALSIIIICIIWRCKFSSHEKFVRMLCNTLWSLMVWTSVQTSMYAAFKFHFYIISLSSWSYMYRRIGPRYEPISCVHCSYMQYNFTVMEFTECYSATDGTCMLTYTLGTNDFPELHTLVLSCINFIFVTNSPGPSKHSPQQGPSEKGSRAVSPASSQKSWGT